MKAGISACSNGLNPEHKKRIDELMNVLRELGTETVSAAHIYAHTDDFNGTDEERAADLMKFYKDDSITEIYDI